MIPLTNSGPLSDNISFGQPKVPINISILRATHSASVVCIGYSKVKRENVSLTVKMYSFPAESFFDIGPIVSILILSNGS